MKVCQDSVVDRLNKDGYRYITFDRTAQDDSPGRNDWVTGIVYGKRGSRNDRFNFTCSVDFGSGRVRSVDVRKQ